MRKLLISLLLASAAASPALADRPDHSDRDNARAERQAAHESARSERSERSERSGPAVQIQRPQFTGQGHVDGAQGGGQQTLAYRGRGQTNGGPDPRQVQAFRGDRGDNNDSPDSVRNWRGDRRQVMQDRR